MAANGGKKKQGGKQNVGHSRQSYFARAEAKIAANKSKRKAKAVVRRAADKAKILRVPHGTARAKRRETQRAADVVAA